MFARATGGQRKRILGALPLPLITQTFTDQTCQTYDKGGDPCGPIWYDERKKGEDCKVARCHVRGEEYPVEGA
jgi:hypothetical protein